MPKRNGKEVYEELRKVRPDLKALFMSGYTADIIREKGVLDQDILFLAKPVALTNGFPRLDRQPRLGGQ